jgi:hypothetical protein
LAASPSAPRATANECSQASIAFLSVLYGLGDPASFRFGQQVLVAPASDLEMKRWVREHGSMVREPAGRRIVDGPESAA